jgi:uncharacterized protein YndB with AHSA1/START domain
MNDVIEQELRIEAPIERVWQIITDPVCVARWFGNSAEIDLRPGGPLRFGWDGHGPFHGVVERVDPPREFAYRWVHEAGVPVSGQSVETRVSFSLSEVDGGTLVRLVESGFADEQHYKENAEGWTEELADLAAFVSAL